MRTTIRFIAVLGSCSFALVAVGALGCVGGTGPGSASALSAVVGGAACPELSGGAMNANFDADAEANGTIRAFVTAAGDLATVAGRVEAEVGTACERIAADLGMDPQSLRPRGDESRTAAACNAVAARIDGILKQGASASVRANVTPPQCQVSADAEAQCRAQCNVNVDPGYVKAHCDPGKLYGRCEGVCSGRCEGTCAGQASGTSANGQCNGQCNGDCHGRCNVEFKEPKCEAAVKAPRADARCESSCKAHAEISASCTEAKVDVRANVNAGELPKLVASLERNLPVLVKAQIAYGQRLGDDVEVLVRTGAELPRAFGHLSARAGACVAAAANATVRAQAQIRVSVQASASISGKVGAGT